MKNRKKLISVGRWQNPQRLLCMAMLMLFALAIHAQNVITGKVVDNSGESVIGATVQVKNTKNVTVTDFDGKFTLQNVAGNATLVAKYIGYKTQEVALAGKKNVTITLEEDSRTLTEVVVVGYGTQKRSDVTGAMTRVGEEQLNARPVSNAFEALQGKAAGVDITTNERPGEIGSILIRGSRSITATNAPLYVVDGVPLMSASAIETLNPRDIEAIDVLKDASATAIYGSRGANGVIIVTTKQGKDGKFSINYSGTLTTSSIVDRSPSMSAADYIKYRRWAAYNSDPTAYAHPDSPTKESDMKLFDSPLDGQTSRDNVMRGWANGTWDASKVESVDWADLVTRNSLSHEHTLSVSGGTDKLNSYISFGYLNNKGTQIGQEYDRYTGKLSLNIKPTKWFSVSGSMNLTWSEQDYGMSTLGGRSGSVPDAIYGVSKTLTSISLPYDTDGNMIIYPGGESSIYNIVDEWEHNTNKTNLFRALGSISATIDFGSIYSPLKGLKYKMAFGPDFRNTRNGVYIDGYSSMKISPTGEEGVNYARLQNRRDFSWTLDNIITYDRTFAELHKVGFTFLQTASKWKTENSSMSANNIAKDSYMWNAFGTVDITNADNKAAFSSGLVERQLESYMLRLNYGFNEKYLLTVSGRWDGASQLAEGHKWDFFPSAALAWRINQEDFLSNVKWVDNLKLRVGVGVTGNSSVEPYATKGDIQTVLLPFNGMNNVTGYTTNEPFYTANQLAMANSQLGWEKTTQWNVGVDFAFLKNRISGTLDMYWSKTNDLLMKMSIPTLTGYSSTYANVGKTSNHGIELTLNAVPVIYQGFRWETGFNVAYQKDKIEELAYGKNDMVDNAWFIGESIAVHYGYKNDGIWQDTPEDKAEMEKWNANGYTFEPGNVRPHDVDGDYKMTTEDRVVLGNRNPTTTLGWSNNFSWKGIELGISMIGRMGYTFSTGGEALCGYGNQREVDYWTPNNTGAEYQKPILTQITSGSKDNFSSLLGFKKASFLKVRNISLGYNVPERILKAATLSHLKVYAQVINPFSIHQSIDGFDLDTGRTYFNRSFVFGLEVGF